MFPRVTGAILGLFLGLIWRVVFRCFLGPKFRFLRGWFLAFGHPPRVRLFWVKSCVLRSWGRPHSGPLYRPLYERRLSSLSVVWPVSCLGSTNPNAISMGLVSYADFTRLLNRLLWRVLPWTIVWLLSISKYSICWASNYDRDCCYN